LLKVVRAQIGQVKGGIGQTAAGSAAGVSERFRLEGGEIGLEAVAQFQEPLPVVI